MAETRIGGDHKHCPNESIISNGAPVSNRHVEFGFPNSSREKVSDVVGDAVGGSIVTNIPERTC